MKSRIYKFFGALISSMLIVQPTFAAKKASTKSTRSNSAPAASQSTEPLVPVPEVLSPFKSDKEYNALMAEIKASPRSMAAASTDVPAIESKFEKDFLTLRDELIGNGREADMNQFGVKTPVDLDHLIKKYTVKSKYNELSLQAKFLVLQLRALAPFKSFIFRARKYVGNSSATRTMIVTSLRSQMAGIQSLFLLPNSASVNHWEVVFKYITEPLEDMGPPIDTDAAFYSFYRDIATTYMDIHNDFVGILSARTPIWWDNKLFMSFAGFSSEKDRYVLLGQAELYALHSAIALNQSALMSTTAYSFDGLQASIRSTGKLFGIDGFGEAIKATIDGQGADGMSSMNRIGVLNSHRILFVRVSDGAGRMEKAYSLLVNSAQSARVAFELAKKLPEGQESLFDPRVANAFSRVGNVSFSRIDQLISEKEPIASTLVAGERIKVSLKRFYYESPEYLSDLYPQEWVRSPETTSGVAWGAPVKLRNYKFGMATEWKAEPYLKLFPDMATFKAKDGSLRTRELPKYARILSQTWGAAVFAIPLGFMVF